MSDETDGQEQRDANATNDGDERVTDAETSFEEYTGEKKCPECGEPVINVRANCPNCAYEYQDSDYDDKEAGAEFVAGSAVDDEGNEIPDDATGGGAEEDSGDDDGSKDG